MKLSAKFKKACKNQGFDAEKIMPDFSMYPEKHRAALAAIAQLFILSDDANKGWEPDFNDNIPKYRPWIDMEKTKSNPSGFRFAMRTTSVRLRLRFSAPALLFQMQK